MEGLPNFDPFIVVIGLHAPQSTVDFGNVYNFLANSPFFPSLRFLAFRLHSFRFLGFRLHILLGRRERMLNFRPIIRLWFIRGIQNVDKVGFLPFMIVKAR